MHDAAWGVGGHVADRVDGGEGGHAHVGVDCDAALGVERDGRGEESGGGFAAGGYEEDVYCLGGAVGEGDFGGAGGEGLRVCEADVVEGFDAEVGEDFFCARADGGAEAGEEALGAGDDGDFFWRRGGFAVEVAEFAGGFDAGAAAADDHDAFCGREAGVDVFVGVEGGDVAAVDAVDGTGAFRAGCDDQSVVVESGASICHLFFVVLGFEDDIFLVCVEACDFCVYEFEELGGILFEAFGDRDEGVHDVVRVWL